MRPTFKPRPLFGEDNADQDPNAPLAPIGSNPLDGNWLPAPLQAEAPATTPPDEIILLDLTAEIEHHTIGALAASTTAKIGAAASPIATRSSYTSGATGAYNVTLQFQGSWTIALQDVFITAANRISATIVGDLKNVKVGTQQIDDIVISAELKAIDGAGGILGQAGPTALRVGSFLPATAMMRFDSADAAAYHALGLFDEIVTHEMMHAVGIGSIWANKALLSGAGFIGPNATAEYAKLVDAYAASHAGSTTLANGTKLTKGAVPIETAGGAGTARVHWSEAVFDSELMTGWLDTAKPGSAMVADPMSALTTASLKDLGYVVATRPPSDLFYLG